MPIFTRCKGDSSVVAQVLRHCGRARRLAFVVGLSISIGQLISLRHAGAAEISTDVGVTLNPIVGGVHESFNDLRHLPLIPIPLLEVRACYGRIEIDAGGLPPIAAVASFDAVQGRTLTRLSIFGGIARVWDRQHRLSVGIGQTIYNQSTHYADAVEIAATGETQFSRVTGVTYQIGYDAPFANGRLEATVSYAPAMLGIQHTMYDVEQYRPRADPEKAEQIDPAVRFVRRVGTHGEFSLGLRYVNYTASYVEGSGGLSDRNVGVLAVVGYRQRLGR